MNHNSTCFRIWTALLLGFGGLYGLTTGLAGADEAKEEFSTRLFFANPDGSNLKPVVEFDEYQSQGSPNWSLDGKLIAFDAWKPQRGEEFSASRVIVVDVDGTHPRKFNGAAMPSFSPDGQRFVFSSPTKGGVWVTNVNNQSEEDYISIANSGWGADWSRDGRIVYATRLRGGANLRIVKLVEDRVETAGDVEYLFDEDESPYLQIYWNMAWSADGKRIAFKASDKQGKLQFGIVDSRGEKFGLVTRDEGDLLASFAWSPDNSHVLFVKKAPDKAFHQVFSAAPDTKDIPKPLPGLDPLRRSSDIAYSPDGKRLLLTCGKREVPTNPVPQQQ